MTTDKDGRDHADPTAGDGPRRPSRDEIEAVLAKPVWTLEDIAIVLSRTPESIRKMRKLGHLAEAYRVGKRLYWKRDDFLEWFETQREVD